MSDESQPNDFRLGFSGSKSICAGRVGRPKCWVREPQTTRLRHSSAINTRCFCQVRMHSYLCSVLWICWLNSVGWNKAGRGGCRTERCEKEGARQLRRFSTYSDSKTPLEEQAEREKILSAATAFSAASMRKTALHAWTKCCKIKWNFMKSPFRRLLSLLLFKPFPFASSRYFPFDIFYAPAHPLPSPPIKCYSIFPLTIFSFFLNFIFFSFPLFFYWLVAMFLCHFGPRSVTKGLVAHFARFFSKQTRNIIVNVS